MLKPRRGKPELSMFAEMRQFAETNPDVAPEEIVQMATHAGAVALGLQDRIGGIFPGCSADLTAIPFKGGIAEAAGGIVTHAGEASATMIKGRWVAGEHVQEG
jgi:cytosine/adenosine deaminase-related metal-dependent hydrolase